ncbi:MAG: MFS transporter [bacterium]|nr:MFS transporter [bacterium]
MTRRAIGVFVAGFFTVCVAYAVRYGYGMLLPEMLPALGISKTQAGVIYSSYFLAYTICSPVLGLLSDRYDVRLILTVFSGMLAAGAFFMAYASSVFMAGVCFTLAGIGHSACWAPVVALVQKWADDKRRGSVLAVTTMGSGVGIAAWGLLLPSIVGNYGWKAGWIGLGVFGFFVAGLNFILVKNPPVSNAEGLISKAEPLPLVSLILSYRELLGSVALWRIGISYLFVGFTVLVPCTFLSAYAKEQLNLPYSVSTSFIAVIAMAGMVGKLALGILSDYLGRVRVMILCGALLAMGCLGMACFQCRLALYGAAGIFGLGFGAVWPVYAAAAPDFFSRQSAGRVIGLWTVFLGVGSILSPILCGWTIDRTGAYTWAFVLGLVSALTSAVLLVPAMKPAETAP